LIWIKAARCRPLFKGIMSLHRSAPAIRHCPLCGVAMQASRSRESLKNFDTFRCLTCDTTIVEKASTGKAPPPSDI
jgi:hypothetical protein